MPVLTIFTPTYNRGYILDQLYLSLCSQTNRNFIWLIVDDGSSDGTEQIVSKWQQENKINIEYIYQENQGKHQAHNTGSRNCSTELFTCVDSDDRLLPVAVETIYQYWKAEPQTAAIAGYCCRRGDLEGKPLGKRWPDDIQYISFFDLYHKKKYRGETMLVWKSAVLKQVEFPVFEGEKFVTEDLLYNKLSGERKFHLMSEVLYLFAYREDGYTRQGDLLFAQNPCGYALYLKQQAELHPGFFQRLKWKARYIGWVETFSLQKKIDIDIEKKSIFQQILQKYAERYQKKYKKLKRILESRVVEKG